MDVRLFGYLDSTSGLGTVARRCKEALSAAGACVTTQDVHATDAASTQATPGGIDLIVVNPDRWDALRLALGPRCGRLRVACWFWELEAAPDAWCEAARDVDALLVASPFMLKAFAKFGLPSVCIPVPVRSRRVAGASREALGLPAGVFLFLAAADFNSFAARKNPVAAIIAFRRAFPTGRKDVGLIVKCSNARAYPVEFARLLESRGGDGRITIIDALMPEIELAGLQQCIDAFVSLHRSEGYGLMIAECMALGKPVLATGWSGNLAFMTEENSVLVDYSLQPVDAAAYPHAQGCWADPNLEHAASLMRRLVDQPGAATGIGLRAQAHAGAVLSPAAVGQRMIDALVALRDGRERGVAGQRSQHK